MCNKCSLIDLLGKLIPAWMGVFVFNSGKCPVVKFKKEQVDFFVFVATLHGYNFLNVSFYL